VRFSYTIVDAAQVDDADRALMLAIDLRSKAQARARRDARAAGKGEVGLVFTVRDASGNIVQQQSSEVTDPVLRRAIEDKMRAGG
jgi:hypothetical protein